MDRGDKWDATEAVLLYTALSPNVRARIAIGAIQAASTPAACVSLVEVEVMLV